MVFVVPKCIRVASLEQMLLFILLDTRQGLQSLEVFSPSTPHTPPKAQSGLKNTNVSNTLHH